MRTSILFTVIGDVERDGEHEGKFLVRLEDPRSSTRIVAERWFNEDDSDERLFSWITSRQRTYVCKRRRELHQQQRERERLAELQYQREQKAYERDGYLTEHDYDDWRF